MSEVPGDDATWIHDPSTCEHEMDETQLEWATCHGGYVGCKLCGDLLRHYSPLRLGPRKNPCPHGAWVPTITEAITARLALEGLEGQGLDAPCPSTCEDCTFPAAPTDESAPRRAR